MRTTDEEPITLAAVPGTVRGRFIVLSELGRGGMSVVSLAWDTETGRYVAIKRALGTTTQAWRRLESEGRTLARLEHPGIARLLGVERMGGIDALVLEFVSGITVSRLPRRLARRGRLLPCETVVAWGLQILAALAHAHGRGVIHRDIKPGNLVASDDGRRVKLIDFCTACCLDDATATLTLDGQPVGTRGYMPPEQRHGRATLTPAADLYALGRMLFALLAGRLPDVENGCGQPTESASDPARSIREFRPDTPIWVEEIIQRMMATDPAHRGTARELHGLLVRRAAAARRSAC